MLSKLIRSLLATLVLGLAVTGSSAYASDASADRLAYDDYECVRGLCVGMQVRVVGGQWAGHAGSILAIDQYQDTLTVLNSSGYYLYPRTYDVVALQAQPSRTGCTANICLGDQVRILAGAYRGRIGDIVDTDDYNYTATILVDGRYIIEDIRDVTLVIRPSRPRPYPDYPRNCPIGYVYDVYRGCVRISYPYPRPYPHPVPRPVPHPRPYPAPHPRPVPRPAPRPAPRPMPRPAPRPAPRPVPRAYPAPRPAPHPIPHGAPTPHRGGNRR